MQIKEVKTKTDVIQWADSVYGDYNVWDILLDALPGAPSDNDSWDIWNDWPDIMCRTEEQAQAIVEWTSNFGYCATYEYMDGSAEEYEPVGWYRVSP